MLPLRLTEGFGLHPAQALLVHFSARRGISTASPQAVQPFGRAPICGFQSPKSTPAPSPDLDASPSPEGCKGNGSWNCPEQGFPICQRAHGKAPWQGGRVSGMNIVLQPLRLTWPHRVRGSSPLTFPDRVALNMHLVDAGLR